MRDGQVSVANQSYSGKVSNAFGNVWNGAGGRPLSFAQERLYLAQAMEPSGYRYNELTVYRIAGDLSTAVLEEALARLTERHEILRTSYSLVEDGIRQTLQPVNSVTLKTANLSVFAPKMVRQILRRELKRLARLPFQLDNEIPVRVVLFTASPREHFLAIGVHHIACDRVSERIFVEELCRLYKAASADKEVSLAPLRMQYADFAAWERGHFTDERLDREAEYWRNLLDGARASALPFKKRLNGGDLEAAAHNLTLSSQFVESLATFARKSGTTIANVLLAALACVISRYTGQGGGAIALPLAARHRPEVENLIGLFINTVVLAANAPPDAPFSKVLSEVSRRAFEAYARSNVPFSHVAERHGLAIEPLLEVAWTFLGPDLASSQAIGAATIEPAVGLLDDKAVFPLEFLVVERRGAIRIRLVYARDMFDRDSIARLLTNYEILLRSAVASPSTRVSELELVAPAEVARLLDQGTGSNVPQTCPDFLELFRSAVAFAPDSPAVSSESGMLTFGELDSLSDRIARLISERSLGRETAVAVFMERSPEVLISLLACLKAGTAYLPISLAYPRDRVMEILSDARAGLVLMRREHSDQGEFPAPLIFVDEVIAVRDGARTHTAAVQDGLGYIIYTSGSTGRPKGVMVERGGLLNHLLAKVAVLELKASDVVAFNAPISFDISIWQMLAPLAVGASVRIFSEEDSGDPAGLIRNITENEVTIFETVPSMLGAMLDRPECQSLTRSKLRCLISNAEALPPAMCSRFFQVCSSIRLLNAYGPTECSDDVSHSHLTADSIAAAEMAPIGTPIENTQLYVLDEEGRLCPKGVAGELYAGGAGVARGYVNLPALTAERFVPDRFSRERGKRLYRTGDLVRWREDGELEFLGRKDQQVKVRGHRIELGEIEAAMSETEGVRQCAVILRQESDTAQLVAYIEGDAEIGNLKGALRRRLPDYMLPQRIVKLRQMPLTNNGKIDRKALPQADELKEEESYQAPRSGMEDILCRIWREVLGRERVGIRDNFFELGGHSLLATQVVSRIRAMIGVEVALRVLFEAPTVEGLAEEVRRLTRSGAPDLAPALERAGRNRKLPLSFAQQRLWFIDQLEPGNPAYNVPVAVRLCGELNVAALAAALTEITRRHEVLRTTFPAENGEPQQLIREPAPVEIPVVCVDEIGGLGGEQAARRLAQEEGARSFDLATGPLLRVVLVKKRESEHVLILVMHHIVSDGWSVGVLITELRVLYEVYLEGKKSPLEELAIQYADYAVWQREWLQGEVLKEQLEYWRNKLEGMQRLELPTDRLRTAMTTNRPGTVSLEIDAGLAEKLRDLSRREGVTLFMTLVAAFQLLLSRYTGQTDVTVGTAIANRNRIEIEPLLGFLVNTLVLRTQLDGDPSVRELLTRVRETVLGAYAHQEMPFEKLVEEIARDRDISKSPLFQVMIVMQNTPIVEVTLPLLRVTPLDVGQAAPKFDLMLTLDERPSGIGGYFEFRGDLFSAATIERLASHYHHVLEECVNDLEQKIDSVQLAAAVEQASLVTIGQGESRQTDFESVHIWFRRQTERTPAAVAVEDGERSFTYSQLDESSGRVACALRSFGVDSGMLVGICLERSVEMVAAMLGVLKSGAAYVPLDPSYPAERLDQIIRASGVIAVIADERVSDSRLATCSAPKLIIADLLSKPADPDWQHGEVLKEQLAYVLYTSGSTGEPKGVAVTHHGLTNHMVWFCNEFAIEQEDRVLQKTVMTFDASVWEFYAPLLRGATLVIASVGAEADPRRLIDNIRDKRVTIVQLVPTMLRLLVDEGAWEACDTLRIVFCGGEALPPELCRKLSLTSGAELVNLYGPTEATIQCTFWRSSGGAALGIGRPITNVSVYVLDSQARGCPIGVAGELYVGGPGVARGYLNRPDLTADRFVPDGLSGERGGRLYRTGDVVRWREDGQLDYLGRLDQQIKLRGYRIEPGEIERVIAGNSSVRQCAVIASENDCRLNLIAYVAGDIGAKEMREYLSRRLPGYMVPKRIITLDKLPLTSNGKINRRALPEIEVTEGTSQEYEAPRTSVEEALCRIWAEVLGREIVGIRENFFEIGGDSILGIQAVARSNQAGIYVTIRDMFEHQCIAQLAKLAAAPSSHQRRSVPQGALPLTPIQSWFFEQNLRHPSHYNQTVLLADAIPIKGSLLQEAVERVLNAHDTFRLRFDFGRRAGPSQQYRESDGDRKCAMADLREFPERTQRRVIEQVSECLQTSLAPEAGRLVQAVRFELIDGGRLLVVAHHLVVDGVSWRILLDQVERVYRDIGEGRAVAIDSGGSSYGQWSRRLTEEAASELTAGELNYWISQRGDQQLPIDHELGPTVVGSSADVVVEFSKSQTEILLRDAPKRLWAQLPEVLVAAVVEAICEWTGESVVLLECEGHGREPFTELDVAQTVGWFTTIFPVRLERGPGGLERQLSLVRDQLRRVPRKGIGYGLLRYITKAEELQGGAAAIGFNYLGQFDSNLGGIFRSGDENAGQSEWDGENLRHVLDIHGSVQGGCLRIVWSYSKNLHRKETIAHVAGSFRRTLEALIETCRARFESPMSSDFLDVELSHIEFEELLAEVGVNE
jgi:amino acid adenylation domain-containing protein/non-ribosomal peptide synthase protein (TIGR01720 family)